MSLEIIDFNELSEADQTIWQPEPGKCYSNVPNEIYHSLKDWNGSSMLKHALRSAESWEYERKQPPKRTLALERGSALHVAMEGLIIGDDWQMFEKLVRSFDGKSIPSKKFLAVAESNPDCYVIPEEEIGNVRIMAEKTFKKAQILNIFHNGYSELSFFWIDEETGIKCKVRPDYLRLDIPLIVDFKTTKDHTEEGFPKEIANWYYHFSAAFYIEGVEQVTGLTMEMEDSPDDNQGFTIIAIANTPPFEIDFKPIKRRSIHQGRYLFRKSLLDIKAFDTDPKFNPTDVPFWALTYIDKEYM